MILVKSELGQRVLKDRSIPLTAHQRAALILMDGKRSVAAIVQTAAAAGVTLDDVRHLVAVGAAREIGADANAVTQPAPLQPVAGELPARERYLLAYPIATQLTAGLGLRGVRLNLAVESARDFDGLLVLAPKIREAVGPERFEPLRRALRGESLPAGAA